MLQFIQFIGHIWLAVFELFNQYQLDFGGIKISYFSLVFAFLVAAMVVSYYWKGAKA